MNYKLFTENERNSVCVCVCVYRAVLMWYVVQQFHQYVSVFQLAVK
jgi:hypothetical protein